MSKPVTPAMAPDPPADSSPPRPPEVAQEVSTEGPTSSAIVPPDHSASPTRSEVEDPAATPAVERCDGCKTGGGRNLVVCIDGTSNQFGMKNTNVVELYSRLEKSDKQLTFYNSGIGTYAEPSWKSWNYYIQVIANILDLAFALRFDKIVISAYAWLVDNYQEGDRIFLFGFSRGAYQVRALSAMIETVGLLHKGNNDQIPFAYELYAASGKIETSSSWIPERISNWRGVKWMCSHAALPRKLRLRIWGALQRLAGKASEVPLPGIFSRLRSRVNKLFDKPPDSQLRLVPREILPTTPQDVAIQPGDLQRKFLHTFSRKVTVHFVGAWDTVSSVGVIRDKTLPMTTDGMRHVCFFRHALALHEYRVKFLPEYARGGNGPEEWDTWGKNPRTKEVWFAGSHSDIGGGGSINTTLDKFGPALRWMSLEATIAGLRIKNEPMKWDGVLPSSSMTLVWRFFEFLPIKRLSYSDGNTVTRWPHLCGERWIKAYQGVHQTVHEDYIVESPPETSYMEIDEWTTAGRFLMSRPEEYWKDGETLCGPDLTALQLLLKSDTGYQSLKDRQIYSHIDKMALACWKRRQHSENACQALRGLALLRNGIFNRAYGLERPKARPLSVVLYNSAHSGPESFPFGLRGHASTAIWVRFASTSLVAAGSQDGTLRLWDTDSGECQGEPVPLTCHGAPVPFQPQHIADVAISPGTSFIVSVSLSGSIQTWKNEAGTIVSTGVSIPLGDDDATSVAFSPDASRIVAGLYHGLGMWDSATGQPAGPEERPRYMGLGSMWDLAVSDDNRLIVSGSRSVRLWDAQTLQLLGDPLPGYTGLVYSVVFSPGSGSIAGGCSDKMVRIWDVETRQLTHILVGHTKSVYCVAFSPSGKHCASGGQDNLIYIWDAVEGRAVGVLKGHTGVVASVSWSPDGTRIVSGSMDETVRVWDSIPVSDMF